MSSVLTQQQGREDILFQAGRSFGPSHRKLHRISLVCDKIIRQTYMDPIAQSGYSTLDGRDRYCHVYHSLYVSQKLSLVEL
jgi:hypothetical protein